MGRGGGTVLTLPLEITERRQWINWALEGDRKIPKTVAGRNARTNDPGDFVTYDEANAASDKIAFVIQPDDELTGIDLDNCLDDSGMLRPWAQPIVARLAAVSFAEISPSGNGIKFLTRASKSPGASCLRKFGDQKQQLECYDFNRFWTITKDTYAGCDQIGDGQEVIDWICQEHLAGNSTGNLAGFSPSMGESSLSLEDRAQSYVDAADGCSEGGRNSAAFRLAGHLFAMESDGRRLSTDQVTSLVMHWNCTCSPPLDDNEIQSTVASALRNGTPREPKQAATLSGGSPKKPTPDRRPQLSEGMLAPDGLIGEMVTFIRQTARFEHPELTLGSCLAFAGMVLGRRVRAIDDTRPNLYCLSIAESGTGKNHPRQTIKKIMHAAGIQVPPEGAASGTGLVRNLARTPSMVVQIDEAGLQFRAMKNPRSPQAELGAQFSELFTASNGFFSYRAYADIQNETRIDQPHLSINAVTTENSMYQGGFSHEDIEQGLFGRFLLFRPRVMDPPERFDIEVHQVPQSIVDGVKSWWDFAPWDSVAGANLQPDHPEPMVVPFSESARERYRNYAMSIQARMQGEDTFRKALWRRSKEKTSRLSLIHACMKGPRREGIVIDKESMDWAIAISNYSTRGMIYDMDYAMVESKYQSDVQYFLSKIDAAGIENWKLRRKLGKFKPKERDEIYNDLLTSGVIVLEEIKTGGPPKTVVKLA